LFQIHTLLSECQYCMEIRHLAFQVWWGAQ
jgi:hypothetical protein